MVLLVLAALPVGVFVAHAFCAERVALVCRHPALLVQTSSGALASRRRCAAQRVPWRAPLTEPGPLEQVWGGLQPVVDRRKAALHGRRKGAPSPSCRAQQRRPAVHGRRR